MKPSRLFLLLCCLLFSTAQADVTVVASIKPLALIAEAIIGDQGEVITLVDAQQSPHDYAMKPSDRLAVQRADVLLWVHPELEIYLADLFPAQGRDKSLITFATLDGMEITHESSGELDPHVWLNTRNAYRLAAAIALAASSLDSANANSFQKNLAKFRSELEQAETQIAALFADKVLKPYGVYHNAWRYFEDQFGLQHAVVLLRNPELQPNVQEIIRVRSSVQEHRLECLLLEPDYNPAVVATMLGGEQVAQLVVDALGNSVPQDGMGYVALLRNIAAEFQRCVL